MSYLSDFTEFRTNLMQAICSDQDLVNLIYNDDEHVAPDRTLPYRYVFPIPYVPETTEEASTYVCLRLSVPTVQSKTVKDVAIYIYVVTHKDLMRAKGGLRIDKMAERVDAILNGSTNYGLGRLKLDKIDDVYPAKDYYGLILKYVNADFNR